MASVNNSNEFQTRTPLNSKQFENRVSGQSLLDLSEDDLRELVPKLGERKAIKRLINSFHPQQPRIMVGAL